MKSTIGREITDVMAALAQPASYSLKILEQFRTSAYKLWRQESSENYSDRIERVVPMLRLE